MKGAKYIYKYPLEINNERIQTVLLPVGAKFLSVQRQRSELVMWWLVNPEKAQVAHSFLVYGTGQLVAVDGTHLGTVQFEPFVWHVYEVKVPPK